MADRTVVYIANLSAPSHQERVECTGPGRYKGEQRCTLFRSNRRIVDFIASPSSVSKIKRGRGKLNITQRAIRRS